MLEHYSFTWVSKFNEKEANFADNLKNIKTNKILFYGKIG